MPSPLKIKVSAMTLVELLVSLSLFSIILLAIVSVDVFTKTHVLSAERRIQVQEYVSYVLSHIAKQVPLAIGNEVLNQPLIGTDSVARVTTGTTTTLGVFIDANQDGRRDIPAGTDRWIGYSYNPTNFTVSFCSACSDNVCSTCSSSWEVLSNKITNFVPAVSKGAIGTCTSCLTRNYMRVDTAACYDPDASDMVFPNPPLPCGNTENPSSSMTTRIDMPSITLR
jgi:Tfp pilus assembly protein PilW